MHFRKYFASQVSIALGLSRYAGDELALRANVSSTGFEDTTAPIRLMKGTNTVQLHVPEGYERPFDKLEPNNRDSICVSATVQNLTVICYCHCRSNLLIIYISTSCLKDVTDLSRVMDLYEKWGIKIIEMEAAIVTWRTWKVC